MDRTWGSGGEYTYRLGLVVGQGLKFEGEGVRQAFGGEGASWESAEKGGRRESVRAMMRRKTGWPMVPRVCSQEASPV